MKIRWKVQPSKPLQQGENARLKLLFETQFQSLLTDKEHLGSVLKKRNETGSSTIQITDRLWMPFTYTKQGSSHNLENSHVTFFFNKRQN